MGVRDFLIRSQRPSAVMPTCCPFLPGISQHVNTRSSGLIGFVVPGGSGRAESSQSWSIGKQESQLGWTLMA
jgi:hypothetical protein